MSIGEIHKNIIRDTLSLVLFRSVRIDKAIRRAFSKHGPLSFSDRGVCARYTYGITRSWRILWEALEVSPTLTPEGFEALMAAYSLYIHEREPESEYDETLAASFARLRETRRFRESIPDWLDERGALELGNEWDSTIASLNSLPSVTIRVNTLKSTRDDLAARLHNAGIGVRAVEQAESALVLEQVADFTRLDEYKSGFFEIQDASSQLVSSFLDAEPGMRVIDACAGSGGKALHVAAIMRNKGKIIALDTHEKKLVQLKKRALRAGAQIIESRLIRSTKVVKRIAGSADRLLLDVPCSGTGVLRRNPDTKWRLRPEALDRLTAEQYRILSFYSRMTKTGGLLLYANCSIFRSEGEDQIRRFIDERGSEFSLVKEQRIDPRTNGFDGFYMALLKRNPL